MNAADELQKLYLADKTLERLLIIDALTALAEIRNKYARLETLNLVWREVDYALARQEEAEKLRQGRSV